MTEVDANQRFVEPAIVVEGLTKSYKLYKNPVLGPVKECIPFLDKSSLFTRRLALEGVSFSVERGQVLGIVGRNGCGKTTLLKAIAGLLFVDQGNITVNGTVTPILTLGMIAQPEFPGRENIRFGGLLLGMSEEEIRDKEAGIIEFSELGEYIDAPFRTYSSGMQARLMFSIAMSVNPEILIVDEALSTGDPGFVKKCHQKISELCRSGATVIFVSHNLGQIRALCDRCLVMSDGKVMFDGPPDAALSSYARLIDSREADLLSAETGAALAEQQKHAGQDILIRDIYLRRDNERCNSALIGSECDLVVEIEARTDLPAVTFYTDLKSEKSSLTYAFLQPWPDGDMTQEPVSFALMAGRHTLSLSLERLSLGDGGYTVDLFFFDARAGFDSASDNLYCDAKGILKFNAVYPEGKFLGRGTMSEVLVKSFSVHDIG